jgi:uncharacterized membrane protein YsdA (DUF1294 family)
VPAPLPYAGMALLIAGAITVGIWYAFSQQWAWQPWLLAWLVGVNVTALVFYGYDKSRAKRQRERVPEVVLYGLALSGGSAGAYLAMHLFRHKTVKGRFLIVFWGIVLVQLAVAAAIVREVFFRADVP